MTDIHDLVAETETDHDWIVEDQIARGDRVILTGEEGKGKSTWNRQYGCQVSSGMTPFGEAEIPAKRVLLIDFENSRDQIRDKCRGLVTASGSRLARGMFHIECHNEGIDLSKHRDREWYENVIKAYLPDLLITGPIYKMTTGSPIDEQPARALAGIFDSLRVRYDHALILEAHTPYAQQGMARPERPYGASLWSRWPEFGLFLAPDGAIRHWRNPREERYWPQKLHRGTTWPWEMGTDEQAAMFLKLVTLAYSLGRRPSVREIEQQVGCAKSTASRVLRVYAQQWASLTLTDITPRETI